MTQISFFKGYDSENQILQALEDDGIVGIHGGRVEVRNKLKKVQALIDENELNGFWAHSTINHPETELGYGYNEERFSLSEAQSIVTKAYNKQHV